MSEANSNQEIKTTRKSKLHRKFDAIGCALFFIWMGIAILAKVGWGIGLIGIGVIIIGLLLAKEYMSSQASNETSKVCC